MMADTPRNSVLTEFPEDVPDRPELVSCRREGDLVWVRIERPEVMNSLSFPTVKRMRGLLEELREDLSIRCILFTGAGEKAFCAGADLKERREMPVARVPLFLRLNSAMMDDLASLPQPTVAVVNGFALGGGAELMLACDLRIASSTARLGLTETSLAIIPGAGGTQRLPRLVGASRAKDLILTARRIDAVEALSMGLVNRVVEPEALIACAKALAEMIAANAPIAVRVAKESIDSGLELAIEEGLEVEAWCYEKILKTADRREALEAFAEKRKPVYQGE